MACHLPDEGEQQRREGIDLWFLRLLGAHLLVCCCVVECAGAVPVLLSMYYAILEESNKRLNASDSAALRRAFAVRLDCLNADLERGWIVLMVARSNRQRSDRQRKRLSALLF